MKIHIRESATFFAAMKRRALVHILGYIGLTVILTAGAAQSLSGTNTVFSDDIVDGQVAYADIRNNAMTGAKILDNSITGADVNESTLVLTCPSGLARVAHICYSAPQSAQNWFDAMNICLHDNLRLPSVPEGRMLAVDSNTSVPLWTDVFYDDSGEGEAIIVNNEFVTVSGVGQTRQYSCMTNIGARP